MNINAAISLSDSIQWDKLTATGRTGDSISDFYFSVLRLYTDYIN